MVTQNPSNNAQPHWHIHNMFSAKNKTNSDTFNPNEEAVKEFGVESENEDQTPTFILNEDFSEFHFAMSAQWHKTLGTHSNKLEDKNSLFLWTEGCMKYIVAQLGEMSGIS